MRRLFLTTSAIALCSLTPAHAQQAIPETVVTATRIPTPAERVPAAVTVLDRQDIEERGYQTLAEALQFVPGLRLVQQGGPGQSATAFIRGAAGRQVLVLLDGVPINDPSTPNAEFNFGNELLGDIERIEVVRGPFSSLYGSGAIGGVVNLITRRAPANTPFQAFGDLAGGTQRTVRGTLGAAGDTGNFDWMVAGQSFSSQGFNVTPSRLATNLGERDGLRAGAGTLRLGWQPLDGTRIEGLLRWRENTSGYDSVPRDVLNLKADDRRWYGNLRAETTLFGIWTTGLRVAVTEDRRRYESLPTSLGAANLNDAYRGTRTTYDWGNQVRLGAGGPFTDLALAFGATHERESVDSAAGSPFFRTLTNASATSTAFHAGAQGRLFERLDLSAGLRRDEAQGYDGFTSWRTGAVLAVPEAATRLRAAAGTAFKAPSLFQRFGTIGASFRGNPNLDPETSFSWEVGSETDVRLFGRADFATLGATYFDTRFRDLITFNQTFSSLANIERARARGVELSATVRPASWLDLRAAWTIQQARDETNDRPLARRPRNVATLAARIAPDDRLVIVPELLLTGRSPETAAYADSGAFIGGVTYNKPGAVLNLTASYRVTPVVMAYAEGRNLTGSRFEPANGFVIPGRSLLVGTRFTF